MDDIETKYLSETGGVQVIASNLNKWVRKDLNLLQDISLCFKPNEFIVIVGQSGGGKSTLLDAISGYRPATSGQVLVNHVDAYKNFDAIRTMIGYVPQRDIIHMELTVYQALDYAAKLRLPRHTCKTERKKIILEVLEALDLTHRKDIPVSKLSGGQQKRVSIGVELLTSPKLFFLDEPTSGLDPGTETSLMGLMRRLADQGRTIVMITHSTKNVMLADKVVFLARGGHLAWFGPAKEALTYFDPFRAQAERDARPMEFDDIYALLEDIRLGDAKDWAERYRQSEAYKQYIRQELDEQARAGEMRSSLWDKLAQMRENYRQQIRPIRQFFILSARNLRILARDRASLILMLFAPFLVASLDLLIAPMMGRNIFDANEGAPVGATQSLFLLTLYTLMVSALSQMREIVKENNIYQRERMVNLRILPYVGSKVWVAVLLAIYQATAFTGIRYLAFTMPGGEQEFWWIFTSLFLACMAGMMLGLFASALSPSAASAPMVTILLIIPNIVLSGALVTLPAIISKPSSSYWAFKALVGITGVGSDIAADDCWEFPPEMRQQMTTDDKIALECRCMGVAMFDPQQCDFPGTGKFYTPAISQSAPEKPAELGAPPQNPVFPSPPEAPADSTDKVAVAQYLNALQDYQSQVAEIQNEFKIQMEGYQRESAIYQYQMMDYQEVLSDWYVARAGAIGAAEGNITAMLERFGWAFVNKENALQYQNIIFGTWKAQGVIITVLIFCILGLMKLKDSKT